MDLKTPITPILSCKFFGTVSNLKPNTEITAFIDGNKVGETIFKKHKTESLYELTVTGGYLDGTVVSFKGNDQVLGMGKFLAGQEVKVNLVFVVPNEI